VSASPSAAHTRIEHAWREHSPALLAYARTLTRDPVEAEDWVAEAYARTMAAINRGAGPNTDTRGYLFAAVRSLRAEAARRPVRVEPVEAMPEHHPDMRAADRTEHVVDTVVATRAYASLPQRWQQVVHLLAVDDARVDQVAERFGITPNAASVLARRAHEGLRAAYLQQWCPPAAETACEPFRADLVGWVRGTLPSARSEGVDGHVQDCEDCAAAAALLRGEGRRLRAIPIWLLVPTVPVAAVDLGSGGEAGARPDRARPRGLGSMLKLVASAAAIMAVVTTAGIAEVGAPHAGVRGVAGAGVLDADARDNLHGSVSAPPPAQRPPAERRVAEPRAVPRASRASRVTSAAAVMPAQISPAPGRPARVPRAQEPVPLSRIRARAPRRVVTQELRVHVEPGGSNQTWVTITWQGNTQRCHVGSARCRGSSAPGGAA
jgi:RNA polymerase sigma factor (sigma-70 family)